MAETTVTRKETPPEVLVSTSVIGVPLLLTAVRCILQYILVPFVLPFIGLGSAFGAQVNLAAGVFGIGLILYNLRRLWPTSWGKRYLALSLIIIPIILVSLYFDYQALIGA